MAGETGLPKGREYDIRLSALSNLLRANQLIGHLRATWQGHSGTVTSVDFSPDGRRVVSGSWDNSLRLWDAETGRPIGKPWRGHSSGVTSVAFSPDGRRVVSGSLDNSLRLWDAATGHPIGEPWQGHSADVWSVDFSPDG
ncbi:WD40 repeat domain-containing protein, partial [Candidatus Thiosymbion oneisti]